MEFDGEQKNIEDGVYGELSKGEYQVKKSKNKKKE